MHNLVDLEFQIIQ